MKPHGKKRLAHYWVTCDRCGHGRWLSMGSIQSLKSLHHHCKSCARFLHAQDHILKEFPNAIYENNRWKTPILCPDCKESRLVRLSRARTWGTEHPCQICVRRRTGLNSKVGIRTETGKTCPRCHKFKSYSEFRRRSSAPDKCQSRCKVCDNAYKRQSQRVRSARKRSNGGSFTTAQWKQLCDLCDNRCLACGRGDVNLTADHVIPVSKGGSSNIGNIQPLCRQCNVEKGIQTIDYRPRPLPLDLFQ